MLNHRTRSRKSLLCWLFASVAFGVVMSIATSWLPLVLDADALDDVKSRWGSPILSREPWTAGSRRAGLWVSHCYLQSPHLVDLSLQATSERPPAWAVVPRKDHGGFVESYAVGLPIRSLSAAVDTELSNGLPVSATTNWITFTVGSQSLWFPARVHWLRLLANIALYAILAAGSVVAATTFRRRLRRARGH